LYEKTHFKLRGIRMNKLTRPETGHVVMKQLPDFVAQVFYRNLDTQAWRNDIGTAFGNSKPNTDAEIKKALTWLASCFGGYIVWNANE
jgi:hypothetical protein